MHKYLKAIGFSMLEKNSDMEILLKEVIKNYDKKKYAVTNDGRSFVEFTREFAPDAGLRVCGEYTDEDNFHMEYYFPYLTGSVISSSEEIIIERQPDKESYIGACDDMRLDITMIFHLNNTGDYLQISKGDPEVKASDVSLSALCVDGMVLLPVLRGENYAAERTKKVQKRTAMIMAARNGDEEAIENLTIEDMDMFNEVSKRAQNEDIYSIVDNCFMPYGFGTDMYSVIGDIKGIDEIHNIFTNETLCKLNLTCNGIDMDVCINKKDLKGEPQIGRRFKGVIWLQGTVDFQN